MAEGKSTVIDWGQFVRIELSACVALGLADQ